MPFNVPDPESVESDIEHYTKWAQRDGLDKKYKEILLELAEVSGRNLVVSTYELISLLRNVPKVHLLSKLVLSVKIPMVTSL